MRAGCRVVELPPSSEISRSVLISPGVPVFIARVTIPDDPLDAVHSDVEDPLGRRLD